MQHHLHSNSQFTSGSPNSRPGNINMAQADELVSTMPTSHLLPNDNALAGGAIRWQSLAGTFK